VNHHNFGKHLRLLNSTSFQAVFDAVSERASTKEFLLLARENGLDFPRLGIIVSKKVSKRAVDRNRIKRVIRESFRQIQDSLPQRDIIILVRPPAALAENSKNTDQLQYLWKKLNKNVHKKAKTSHN